MLNVTGKYVSVYDVEDKGNYVQAKLRTGRKNKDGSYTNMTWRARFVGNANEPAKNLQDKERIEIVNGIIENSFDANGKQWHNVVIFDFKMQE